MKSCGSCKKRKRCVKICQEIESGLPREYTGRDSRREVGMSEAGFMAVMDGYSYNAWRHAETVSKCPGLDLSVLTAKEKKAVMLIASGMGMRAAARRLNISLNALQCRVNTAKKRLLAGQCARLMRTKTDASHKGSGGGR